MLSIDDVNSLRGATIAEAEVREHDGRQVLRLHLEGGAILALFPEAEMTGPRSSVHPC
jgi:hypothetical protein